MSEMIVEIIEFAFFVVVGFLLGLAIHRIHARYARKVHEERVDRIFDGIKKDAIFYGPISELKKQLRKLNGRD